MVRFDLNFWETQDDFLYIQRHLVSCKSHLPQNVLFRNAEAHKLWAPLFLETEPEIYLGPGLKVLLLTSCIMHATFLSLDFFCKMGQALASHRLCTHIWRRQGGKCFVKGEALQNGSWYVQRTKRASMSYPDEKWNPATSVRSLDWDHSAPMREQDRNPAFLAGDP